MTTYNTAATDADELENRIVMDKLSEEARTTRLDVIAGEFEKIGRHRLFGAAASGFEAKPQWVEPLTDAEKLSAEISEAMETPEGAALIKAAVETGRELGEQMFAADATGSMEVVKLAQPEIEIDPAAPGSFSAFLKVAAMGSLFKDVNLLRVGGSAAVGGLLGNIATGDPEDTTRNTLMGAALGAAGGHAYGLKPVQKWIHPPSKPRTVKPKPRAPRKASTTAKVVEQRVAAAPSPQAQTQAVTMAAQGKGAQEMQDMVALLRKSKNKTVKAFADSLPDMPGTQASVTAEIPAVAAAKIPSVAAAAEAPVAGMMREVNIRPKAKNWRHLGGDVYKNDVTGAELLYKASEYDAHLDKIAELVKRATGGVISTALGTVAPMIARVATGATDAAEIGAAGLGGLLSARAHGMRGVIEGLGVDAFLRGQQKNPKSLMSSALSGVDNPTVRTLMERAAQVGLPRGVGMATDAIERLDL
jgi:hypothetical protein